MNDERDKVLQKVKDIEALVDDYTKRCDEFYSKTWSNIWSNISLVIIGIICGIFIGYLIQ